ncbi:MAG: hypothetical protein U0840_15685 [Gemmataceae bacterium]
MLTSLRLWIPAVACLAGLTGVWNSQAQRGTASSAAQPAMVVTIEGPSPEAIRISRRLRAKTAIVDKLVAGELTLFEAAAWFRTLDRETDPNPQLPCKAPVQDPNLQLCRHVIVWVEGHLGSGESSSQASTWVERLEHELQDHLARHGRVILPDDNNS